MRRVGGEQQHLRAASGQMERGHRCGGGLADATLAAEEEQPRLFGGEQLERHLALDGGRRLGRARGSAQTKWGLQLRADPGTRS